MLSDRTPIIVPLSVRNNARLGLRARRSNKRVGNVENSFEVATALLSGQINKNILLKMLKFFKDEIENSQKKGVASTNDRLLFGGNDGLKFVLSHVKELQKK